jgi:hypothetical protein
MVATDVPLKTVFVRQNVEAATKINLLSQLKLPFVRNSFPSSRHGLEHLLPPSLVSSESQLATLLGELPVLSYEFHLMPILRPADD